MQILVVEPEHRPELKEIDGSLETMQSIVGGLIQSIYPFDDPVALSSVTNISRWMISTML